MRLIVPVAFLILALGLPGCGTPKDGPPKRSANLHPILEPIPQHEPVSRYGNPASYRVFGKQYQVMASGRDYCEQGNASWYGTKFHGQKTSSGEPYDLYKMTAAHKHLPLPSYVRVTNLENGKSVVVKVNDRGPFHDERLIDLSYAAAHRLSILAKGTGRVEVRSIDPRDHKQASHGEPIEAPQHQAIYLQLGAFKSVQVGMALQLKIEKCLNLKSKEAFIVKERGLYKVLVGPINTETEAQAVALQLSQLAIVPLYR